MAKIKTAIQFGLVYIPVELVSCTKNTDISFNLLYKKTGQRIKYNRTCEDCPQNIPQNEIVKGYEYERGNYVVLTREELDKLKSKKDESIEILQFAALEEIDPVFYDASYYVNPVGAKSAYSLLATALFQEKKVGIAKAVLGVSENLLALRSIDGKLVISKLHFADEVQQNPVSVPKENVKKEELELARKLIVGLTKKLDISAYKNEYKERVKKAIDDKIAGKEIRTTKKTKPKVVTNLMEALKQSVQELDEEQKIIPITTKRKKRA